MSTESLSPDYLETLSYHKLQKLSKEYKVYKRHAKKARIIQKLVGLRTQDEKEFGQDENMDFNNIEKEEKLKVNDASEGSTNSRRLTFTLSSSEKEEKLKVNDASEGSTNSRRLTCTLSSSGMSEGKSLPCDPLAASKSQGTKCDDSVREASIADASEEVAAGKTKKNSLRKAPSPRVAARGTPTSSEELPPETALKNSSRKTPSPRVTVSRPPFSTGRKLGTMPNFKAIHERQFMNMESLVAINERKSKRALFLLSPVQLKKPSGIPRLASLMKEMKKDPVNTTLPRVSRLPAMKRVDKARAAMSKVPAVSMEKSQEKARVAVTGVRMNKRFQLLMQMRNA